MKIRYFRTRIVKIILLLKWCHMADYVKSENTEKSDQILQTFLGSQMKMADSEGWPKIFENSMIIGTMKSQNGRIAWT